MSGLRALNKVLLVGNLTRDPELKYTGSGIPVTKFGLAVNRRFKSGGESKEDTCFVDITVFGKTAENCSEYIEKGQAVFVEGRLSFSSWENKEGQRRSKLEVIGERVQFLGRSGSNDRNNAASNNVNNDDDSSNSSIDSEVPF